MTLPGTTVTSRAEAPSSTTPTDTGLCFLVGTTTSGETTPATVSSFTEYVAVFGARTTNTETYDAAQAFFADGGSRLTVAKVDDGDDLIDALNRLDASYGPGQLVAPQATTDTDYELMLDHAAANNRIALLDADPALPYDDIAAAAIALSSSANARYGAMFAPQVQLPEITAGVERPAGYAAIQAALIAKSDAANSPNVPAAGANGISNYSIDVAATYTDAERTTLNDAGVNVARKLHGSVRTYGYRTLVDPESAAAAWLGLGNARLNMAITAKAEAIAESFVFSQLDGKGHTISAFGGALTGMLVPYFEAGSLYGATPDAAFNVDVGSEVNTPTTIAAGELRAVLSLRLSPFAERVVIEIVKKANTEAL